MNRKFFLHSVNKTVLTLLVAGAFMSSCKKDDSTTPTPTSSVPTLTTTAVTEITDTSAHSGGNITAQGSAAVTARGIVWSTNENPTIALSTKTSDGTGTGTFSSHMSGLTANTKYYVRAYATSSAGTAYGAQTSFTTTGGSSATAVNITFKVDVTAYLAGGATLGAGGIRVGGAFADLSGTLTNGTAMLNWNPTDAASALTDLGNNIWAITVTFPADKVGSTLYYKFVNDNWGTNEGTAATSTIATGGCGVDDGAGNINRTLTIPSADATLTFCWDQCTETCQ